MRIAKKIAFDSFGSLSGRRCIDELAQAEAPFAQGLSPRANTFDDQGNAAELGQQHLPGLINPLGESQLLIARKQLIIANVSEVNVEWIPQAARIIRTTRCRFGATRI